MVTERLPQNARSAFLKIGLTPSFHSVGKGIKGSFLGGCAILACIMQHVPLKKICREISTFH